MSKWRGDQVLPRGVGLDFWKGKVYMFVHSGIILLVIVIPYSIQVDKIYDELSMFFSAIVAAFTHSLTISIRTKDIVPLIPIRIL